ncbi:unnamed protein product [Anisakis simplex]|uniref:Uncharacterized protein n=1 Tax=Anisakis simplex TaxID=6269 RepID=A0A3P6PNU0_ANISI|nr:unnamed protein product [Anisakis simplex]
MRTEADDLYKIRLRPVQDPITHAWRCGKAVVNAGGAFNQRIFRCAVIPVEGWREKDSVCDLI